jgi:hypothetical protein
VEQKQLQACYELHRTTRNEQQKAKILDGAFTGWVLDEYLTKLDGPRRDPAFIDPRNCLVFWARPPRKVRDLVEIVQQRLRRAAPGKSPSPLGSVGCSTDREREREREREQGLMMQSDLWLMPPDNLHMTAMEVTHSRTAEEIDHLVSALEPNVKPILDLPFHHRTRLIRPTVCYDSAALALSFVPASGEKVSPDNGGGGGGDPGEDDEYTYHHLRRDLYSAIEDAGVKVASRYVVPSAHLTVARFNTPNVFGVGVGDGGGDGTMDPEPTMDAAKRMRWIEEIDAINGWLETEYWPQPGKEILAGGEWRVGEERGLDFRKGRLWYGGGETIALGASFERFVMGK